MHAVGSAASTLISYGVLILLMLLLAVGAAFAVVQAIRNRRGEETGPLPPTITSAPPIGPSKSLDFDADDPDALAAAGRYAEAVLALLVRCLKTAGWQRHEVGRTAREVLHATSHSAKGALRTVVLGAERIQFGGQDASKAIYDDLRAAAAPLLMP